jgi:hypothetical protein
VLKRVRYDQVSHERKISGPKMLAVVSQSIVSDNYSAVVTRIMSCCIVSMSDRSNDMEGILTFDWWLAMCTSHERKGCQP